jgi:hypothetical protein
VAVAAIVGGGGVVGEDVRSGVDAEEPQAAAASTTAITAPAIAGGRYLRV